MSRRFALPNASEVVAAPGPTPSGLTETRVPFAGENGRLEDSSELTFASSTLRVPNIFTDGYIASGGGTFNTQLDGSFEGADGLFNVESVGRISVYSGLPTQGLGVPAIVDDVALTAQAAVIGSTNFTNAGAAGTYKLVYYLVCTTADATAGSIRLDVTANDGTAARTLTGTAIALTATNRTTKFTNAESDGSLIKLGSGSVAYTVVLVSGAINAARFSLYASLMRLS